MTDKGKVYRKLRDEADQVESRIIELVEKRQSYKLPLTDNDFGQIGKWFTELRETIYRETCDPNWDVRPLNPDKDLAVVA